MIVDEAHRLKNANSALHKGLLKLDVDGKLLITGTPLQNNTKELLALMKFLNGAARFGIDDYFELEDPDADERVAALHGRLQSLILRRLKQDVTQDVPRKVEHLLRCPMTPAQQEVYESLYSQEHSGDGTGQTKTVLHEHIMQLRKAANHRSLLHPPSASITPSATVDELLAGSGKLRVLDQLLTRLAADKRRVLIFSQFVVVLDILQDYLLEKGYAFQVLHGSVGSAERQHAIDAYNSTDSQDFVFLISTRAGGCGVNLQSADTIILFDPDWNPQNDLQAIARAHRIGQTKVVQVYRLVSAGTVEEGMMERASKKLVLEEAVVSELDTSGLVEQDRDAEEGSPADSVEGLQAILARGHLGLFSQAEPDRLFYRDITTSPMIYQEPSEPSTCFGQIVDIDLHHAEPTASLDSLQVMTLGEVETLAVEEDSHSVSHILFDLDSPASAVLSSAEDGACSSARQNDLQEPLAHPRTSSLLSRADDPHSNPPSFIVSESSFAAPSRCPSRYRFDPHLLRLCASAVDAATLQALDSPRTIKIIWDGSEVDATRLVMRGNYLEEINRLLAPHQHDLAAWRPPLGGISTELGWDCAWSETEDARLLLAVWRYGFNDWSAVQADSTLGLSEKLRLTEGGGGPLPQRLHLERRVDFLGKRLLAIRASAVSVHEPITATASPSSASKSPADTDAGPHSRVSAAPSSSAFPPPPASHDPPPQQQQQQQHQQPSTPSSAAAQKKRLISDVYSDSEDGDDFKLSEEDCAEIMRPAKGALRRLGVPLDSLPPQAKAKHLHDVLLDIGHCVDSFAAGQASRSAEAAARAELWDWVAGFWSSPDGTNGSGLCMLYDMITMGAPPSHDSSSTRSTAGSKRRRTATPPSDPRSGSADRRSGSPDTRRLSPLVLGTKTAPA